MEWEDVLKEHEARLTVGTKVRITLSPECEYCDRDGGDGQVGVIVATTLPLEDDLFDYANETDPTILAHHYRVRYEGMTPEDWSGYAATELTVLTPDERIREAFKRLPNGITFGNSAP